MSTVTEGKHPYECLLSNAPGSISFEEVTINSGANLHDGTVLGLITGDSPAYGTSGVLAAYDPDAHDGSEKAVAVLLGDALAASADMPATVLARLGEVKGDLLTWKTGISDADKAAGIADLLEQFIIVRD